MSSDDEMLEVLADKVAERLGGNSAFMACDGSLMANPCGNLMWSPVTVEKFYRSGETAIDVVETGSLPVGPGATTVLTQAPHPGWGAGCIMITYRLANNGTNHQDIKFSFYLDDEPLDKHMYGSEIYDNANHLIGDGWHPLPLAGRRQCCIGAMNRLRVKIEHQGNANELQQPRITVSHGKVACCSACASGRDCQIGCAGEKPRPNGNGGGGHQAVGFNVNFNGGQQQPPPVAMKPPPGYAMVWVDGQGWTAVPSKALAAAMST